MASPGFLKTYGRGLLSRRGFKIILGEKRTKLFWSAFTMRGTYMLGYFARKTRFAPAE